MSFRWDGVRERIWRLLDAVAYQASLDVETGVLHIVWDEEGSLFMGYPFAELSSETVLRRVFGEAYDDWLHSLRQAQEKGLASSWEHTVQTPEGVRHVRHSLDALPPAANNAGPRICGVLRQFFPSVLDAEGSMRLDMIEDLPVGIYFIDLDYRMRWVNRLGMSQSHVNWKKHYGEVCYKLPFGRDSHCPNCPVARSHEEGVTSTQELVMPNGETWLLTAMPVYNRDSEKIGAVEVVTDISEVVKERRRVLETLQEHEGQLRAQNQALIALHGHRAVGGGIFLQPRGPSRKPPPGC